MNEQELGIISFNPEYYLVLIASQSQSYNYIKAFALFHMVTISIWFKTRSLKLVSLPSLIHFLNYALTYAVFF